MMTADWEPAARNHGTCMQDDLVSMPTLWSGLDSCPGLWYCRSSSMGPPRLLVLPSFDLSANKPSRPCPPTGFLRVWGYPANGYPLVKLGLRTKGETMRP
jgi:hypothetical protein